MFNEVYFVHKWTSTSLVQDLVLTNEALTVKYKYQLQPLNTKGHIYGDSSTSWHRSRILLSITVNEETSVMLQAHAKDK